MLSDPACTRLRRVFAASIVLVALSLFASGCVYLRLLDAKAQLADFERYITPRLDGDLVLQLNEPTLNTEDLRLLGLHPKAVTDHGDTEDWDIEFEKLYPAGQSAPTEEDLHLTFHFDADDRLGEVRVPDEYLRAFSPDFIVGALRSMGESHFNPLRRKVIARWSGSSETFASLSQAQLVSILGQPYERRDEDGKAYSKYRYLMRKDGERFKRYWVEFAFNETDGRLLGVSTDSIRFTFRES